MPVIRSQITIPTAQRSGKLVKVLLRPGVYIQLYETDARARGLLPAAPEEKRRTPVLNKKRSSVSDKGQGQADGQGLADGQEP